MRNLSFPEISKEVQQSIYGAWGSSRSDDPTYYGGSLDEVIVGPSGGGNSGGGGSSDWGFGDDQNQYQGGGDNYGGSGGGGGDLPSENQSEWSNSLFMDHYFHGNGQNVSLAAIGFEDDIRESNVYTEMLGRVNDQIEASIVSYIQAHGLQNNSTGPVQHEFVRSYGFTGDAFAIGSATINGNVQGTFQIDSIGDVTWTAQIHMDFYDKFEDPYDVINAVPGSYDPGTPYDIIGNWNENASGTIYNYDAGTTPEPGYGYQYGY